MPGSEPLFGDIKREDGLDRRNVGAGFRGFLSG